jgi:hypothetical protein
VNNEDLIDVFAALAMLGLIHRHRVIPPDVLAKEAYIHADAMIKEKEKRIERERSTQGN